MARGGSPLTKRLEIVPVRCHALAGRGQQRFGACAGSAITTVTGTNPSPDSTERTPKIVWEKPRTASPRAHGAVAVGGPGSVQAILKSGVLLRGSLWVPRAPNYQGS